MAIVGLVGFAGVVVFGLLYIVFFFKDISLKIPVIGMAVFAVVITASVVLIALGVSIPFLDGPAKESLSPGTDGFPQLLLDKRGVVITATGLDESGEQGPVLNVSIENRSETDLTVEVRDACVNGWMMDASFSAAVAAGQSAEGSILFPASRVKQSGIETVAVLELSFHILNQDLVTFLDSDVVTIRTPAADTYQDRFDGSGQELYKENGLRIISKGFSEDASGLVLFLENTSDKTITVQARDVSVNGRAADAVFSEDILAGKRSAAVITVTGVSLGEIREMEFSIRVRDRDERTILFDTDPLTVAA